VVPTVASTAVRMVEKVSEVADHVAAHPSEQVTVRIDLDETHRVDVHVSMRGGQVHADFRSDSPDMRAALASAWNEFSQNGREGSGHRWASLRLRNWRLRPRPPAKPVFLAICKIPPVTVRIRRGAKPPNVRPHLLGPVAVRVPVAAAR
jgi:Flagellar hook-length control protein FliK